MKKPRSLFGASSRKHPHAVLQSDSRSIDVYVGWANAEPAATMILQWSDPGLWPQAKDDSGFIHKLAVRRKFAGTGFSLQMIEWAGNEARRRGKSYLRLDTTADRPKMCAFYEGLDFRRVGRRIVGPFDIAFYELKLG